jgi:hypothetical protein
LSTLFTRSMALTRYSMLVMLTNGCGRKLNDSKVLLFRSVFPNLMIFSSLM